MPQRFFDKRASAALRGKPQGCVYGVPSPIVKEPSEVNCEKISHVEKPYFQMQSPYTKGLASFVVSSQTVRVKNNLIWIPAFAEMTKKNSPPLVEKLPLLVVKSLLSIALYNTGL